MRGRPYRPEQLLGPLNLWEQKHAPSTLYAAGRTKLLWERRPRISIIGSRKASPEGLAAAHRAASRIAQAGGVVVSGLARGIDTAAHKGAIEARGDTIAVIGCGLDRSYPPENAGLQQLLMNEHLVVSQFPEGTPPIGGNFVQRNRTMALLSHASIIIEAGEQSGTMHQGWETHRLGRLLLLPRELLDAQFEWPRELLKYGAVSYEGVAELLEILGQEFPLFETAFA